MKKVSFLLGIIAFCQGQATAQDSLAASDPIILQINNLDFSYFEGKPVDTLLSFLPPGYTSIEMQGSILSRKAGYLVVKYAPFTYVYIAVRTFTHMNPNPSTTGDPKQNWDLDLFKKENVSFLAAFNGQCFKGCQHVYKFN